MSDRLPPDTAVRVLRAKVGELENIVRGYHEYGVFDAERSADVLTGAVADIALVADILASYIEDTDRYFHKIGDALLAFARFTGMTVSALDGLIHERDVDDANVRDMRRESSSGG